jgi:hypothetical protein
LLYNFFEAALDQKAFARTKGRGDGNCSKSLGMSFFLKNLGTLSMNSSLKLANGVWVQLASALREISASCSPISSLQGVSMRDIMISSS